MLTCIILECKLLFGNQYFVTFRENFENLKNYFVGSRDSGGLWLWWFMVVVVICGGSGGRCSGGVCG